ncbi:hypothetical protein GCM10017711_06800 [Paeniglutamicibacter sulfureus]
MDPMDTPAGIIDSALAALGGALGTGTGASSGPGTAVDPLRLLAAVDLVARRLLEQGAASAAGSPVRAAALAQLAERLFRTGSYGQVLAAGTCEAAEVHTLTEAPLAETNQVLKDAAGFAAGTSGLPADAVTGPDRKPLHRDTAEFLKNQLHLSYFQASHRVSTHARLLEHKGPDGTTLPPTFPQLGRALAGGSSDPKILANTAAKLVALAPSLEAQPDPEKARTALEEQVARTLHTADEAAVGRLLKQVAIDLEHTSVEGQEAARARFEGLRFRCHKPAGYIWELTTDAEGHEMLCTLADDLNNPRTDSGTPATPETVSRPALFDEAAIPGTANGAEAIERAEDAEDASEIPAWAVNPDVPAGQRPRAGFNDVGKPLPCANPYGLPENDRYPGETRDEANARRRAQRLSGALLEALRSWMDPAAAQPGMPLNSRVELLVMIDYAALTGALETAGFTSHGQYISAAAARRLACNAGITPVVMGGEGQPLDVGRRKRFFTKGQRRAIAARDRGCANPGCSMPVHRCEAHHLKSFSEGGKTEVSNGLLLCIRCHTAFHAGHFGIRVVAGIPHVVLPASRDPLQRPRRNWVFHPEAAAA